MWEPRPLVILEASTACNRDIFTFLLLITAHLAALIWLEYLIKEEEEAEKHKTLCH
jgi:hypothetical protein